MVLDPYCDAKFDSFFENCGPEKISVQGCVIEILDAIRQQWYILVYLFNSF